MVAPWLVPLCASTGTRWYEPWCNHGPASAQGGTMAGTTLCLAGPWLHHGWYRPVPPGWDPPWSNRGLAPRAQGVTHPGHTLGLRRPRVGLPWSSPGPAQAQGGTRPGVFFAEWWDLRGYERVIVIACGYSPCGFRATVGRGVNVALKSIASVAISAPRAFLPAPLHWVHRPVGQTCP